MRQTVDEAKYIESLNVSNTATRIERSFGRSKAQSGFANDSRIVSS